MSILLILLGLALLVAVLMALEGSLQFPESLKRQVMAFSRRKTEPPAKFRAWVESSMDENPELRAWLLDLSHEGFAALTQRVVAFCADLNIQLSWLVERHVDVAPALQKAVRTIVVDYLSVCREAMRHQDQIALFREYHKLVANPADSRHRDLRRRLFTRLTSDGLAEELPYYELIMASETQRQALVAKAIRGVADKDWQAFAKIFQEVLEAPEDPSAVSAGPAS